MCLSVCFAVSNLYGPGQSCEIRLENQINPNSAPLASLIRLPGIGTVRARAIISYREVYRKSYDKKAAFVNCDDLQKVKGIGPKTAENICAWLKFE